MILGAYNVLISRTSKRHALLLKFFKNRRPNATRAHACLKKDIETDSTSLHFLFEHLDNIGLRHGKLGEEFWEAFTETIIQKKRSPLVLKSLANLDSKDLTPGEWNELGMYLLSFGLFREAVTCRHHSHRALDTTSSKFVYGVIFPILKLASLFDQGLWENGAKIVERQLLLHRNNPFYRKFFLNEKAVGQSLHEDYYHHIKGKRIAVIGPLEFDQDYSDEIAQTDLVIELNGLESAREAAKMKYHGRPDIVYYNNSRNAGNAKGDFSDVVQGASYFVIKNDRFLNKLNEFTPCRVTPQSNSLTWNGTFSMMEITLSDLLLFDPAEVKVYGVDLYLSFNYSSSYGNKPPDSLKGITMNFTVHDIFTQFLFMKKLFDGGYIKADQRLSNVLRLSLEEYAAKLESLYPVYLEHVWR
ncbi:MAG: hypothetical protein CV087_16865 [Candidatus Brocadia sp. WS118]|nr:MAG: hypothetical protein CV087_16865 [Candidatus Brocadia sp. WS118]